MKPYKFSGASLLTVDEKARVLIPVELRRKLGDGDTEVFVIKLGNNGKLWLYPERFYDDEVFDKSSAGNEINPSEEQLERMLSESADLDRVQLDKAGRILLPEPFLSLAGLGRGMEVTLLGVFNHLQLWSREAYASRQLKKNEKPTPPEPTTD